jgi:hypothetical protein
LVFGWYFLPEIASRLCCRNRSSTFAICIRFPARSWNS